MRVKDKKDWIDLNTENSRLDQDNKASKFKIENGIFMTSLDEVSALEIRKELKQRIAGKEFPRGTDFKFVFGVHHGKLGEIGEHDKALFYFHQMVFIPLKNFCGHIDCKSCGKDKCKPGPSFWDKMEYTCTPIPIFTEHQESKNVLTDISKDDLNKLGHKLFHEENPSVLIFGSCFSNYSGINEILRENGVIAALNIMKDKGEVSSGKLYQLDECQRHVIQKCNEVTSKKRFSTSLIL